MKNLKTSSSLAFENLTEKALLVNERLQKLYNGSIILKKRINRFDDPLDELIFTVLSQNTSDVNRDKAFNRLKERYRKWDDVLVSPLDEIASIIKVGGLANVKALRIKEILKLVKEQVGDLSCKFLADLSEEEALKWLLSIKGIGYKSAFCVMLFSLGIDVLPVDTHVYRVCYRLGLLGRKRVLRDRAHLILNKIVPRGYRGVFHVNVILHGRNVCVSKNPKCVKCVLSDICDKLEVNS